MDAKSPLERAFELAMSGQYSSVRAIKRQLFDEGYSTHQIANAAVLAHLKAIIQNQRSRSSQIAEMDVLKQRKPA
jgi:hypothetical protein